MKQAFLSLGLVVLVVLVVGVLYRVTFALILGNDADDGPESAAEALERQISFLADGQAERAYEEIHPAQQAILSREDYAACVDAIGSVELKAVEVVKMIEEEITIAGTDEKAMATVIVAELTIRSEDTGTEETATSTFQEVMVDGEWRLTLHDPPTCT